MRLIDADELMKKSVVINGHRVVPYLDVIEQPTAYDVEAKAAELKKIRDDENCDNVKTEDCLSCKDCNLCLMNRAIEIVRRKE